MVKIDACGTVIWECSTAEARAAWKDHPADRWRIWSNDEVTAHMSSGPDEILAAIEAKRAKPGKLDNIPVSPPTSPLLSAAWCEGEGKLCSEVATCGEVMKGDCASS